MSDLYRKQPFSPRPLPPDARSAGSFAKAVGALIPKVTAAAFERFGFHTAEILTSWATIAGPELARLTQPEQIRWPRGSKDPARGETGTGRTGGATLVLRCDPAFALEISYRTCEVIDRVNRYFGYRAIGQLRLVQTPGASPAALGSQKKVADFSERSAPAAGSADLTAALAALSQNVSRRESAS